MRKVEYDGTTDGICAFYEIIPHKVYMYKYTKQPIKFLFKRKHGFMVENLRFSIRWLKQNPPKMKLRIQIWLPFLYLVRDNSKWEIGMKRRFFIYH